MADPAPTPRPDGTASGGGLVGAAALGAWAAAIVILVMGFALWARSGFGPLPQLFMTPLGFAVLVALVITQATGGLILAVRRPDNPIGPVILSFALLIALAELANGYVALAQTGVAMPFDPAWVAALSAAIAFSGGTLVAVLLGLIFPTGRLISRSWWIILGLAIVGAVAMALGLALTPGPLRLMPGINNPVPEGSVPAWVSVLRDVVGPALLIVGSLGSGGALILRYQQADAVGRLQLRWYLFAGVILAVGYVAFVGAMLFLPADSGLGEIVVVLFYLSACIPPVALVFAILRYRLYDIDRILGRTFVYGALTAILAGLYTASVRLFNALFVDLTGESSEIALVITTLILATTFTPIKRRLEGLVDRWMRPSDHRATVAATEPSSLSAASLLDDPAFVTALARRVAAILDHPAPGAPEPASGDPRLELAGGPAGIDADGGPAALGAHGAGEAEREHRADTDRATGERVEL